MSWPCLLLTFITGEMRRTYFATGSNKIIFKGAVRDHLLMSKIPRVTNTDTLACPATWRPGKESQQSTVFLQNLPTCADMLVQPTRLSKQWSEKLRLQHRQRECAFTLYSGHQDCSDYQPKSASWHPDCIRIDFEKVWTKKHTKPHFIWRWFDMWFRFLQMRLSPTIWPVVTDLNGVFCVTRTATRKGDVKSRETEWNQSGWAESMLLLAERYERQHRENSLPWHNKK